MTTVPSIRIRKENDEPLRPEGKYVLYWMTAFRRLGWNFALQHAADLAREMGKPLVILDALEVDYPYASPRFHRFILDGMAERARALISTPVFHYAFIEREPSEARGLLPALARDACCVVGDEYPSFFLPRLMQKAGRELPVQFELVDSNGILPLRAGDRIFSGAYPFRRFLQKTLMDHLGQPPAPDPLSKSLPDAPHAVEQEVLDRWAPLALADLDDLRTGLGRLPLDLSVAITTTPGGTIPARNRLEAFVEEGIRRYHEDRNHPDSKATSRLSPYLHFGNISSHEIFSAVVDRKGWTPLRLSGDTRGAREGWWGMSPGEEAFMDQLITWRELGFNMAWQQNNHMSFESLPDWALSTLAAHENDPRPHLYAYEEFRNAGTHDPLWNAAQRQLVRNGEIHNYLRMLWGKKILEWSPSPREALEVMVDLNDRFALDGRDPNSYSGIFWCLGRYDRGWPERPVFGKVRSMSSRRTRTKVRVQEYLESYRAED